MISMVLNVRILGRTLETRTISRRYPPLSHPLPYWGHVLPLSGVRGGVWHHRTALHLPPVPGAVPASRPPGGPPERAARGLLAPAVRLPPDAQPARLERHLSLLRAHRPGHPP